jgi:hypothetical protein
VDYDLDPGEVPFTAGWNTKTDGHDPQRVAIGTIPVVPFRFYSSPDDLIAVEEDNAWAFNARLTAASWPVEHVIVECSGGHVSANHFRTSDILDFFRRSAVAAHVYDPYRLFVKGTGDIHVEADQRVREAGVLLPLVHASTTSGIGHPREYVEAQ